jgi:uncharacterized protein YecT (DUF1311 family)
MRRFFAVAATAAAILCAAGPALSAGKPLFDDYIPKWQDDPKVKCQDTSGVTYNMDTCAGRDYQKAYKAMVALYNQLNAKYDAGNKKLLDASQVSWNKYRDDECSYETAGTVGGTINSTMVTNCDTTLTLDRIKTLKAQADCTEGDMSCNHP